MEIQIHADEVAGALVADSHDVHLKFLNAYFQQIARQYKGGYKAYCREMYVGLDSDALMVMQDILKNEEPEGTAAQGKG